LVLDKDKDIVNEFLQGDAELAATLFVRKYRKFVYSTALRFVQNYEDADDIAQEAFIKAINNIRNFRGDSSMKTWLYKITSNLCSSFLRRKKLFSFFSGSSSEDYFEVPSGDVSPHQSVENKEFESRFRKMLARLPEKQRETFALRYFDELPYEEISRMLGTSVGGLKANYYQAVQKLASLLKKEEEMEDR